MPLNTLRLNYQPSTHPNERIVFIKPIPRPASEKDDYDRAELVLKAIAAQCLPIMKDHHLSITTLEEYEPNPEFVGRNFNNGEIIQLVIRSKSGSWLPLHMIQMVMMHELAHNTHMNHGRDFWKARNLYAGEMQQLWSRGYTGEGLWGSGRTLESIGQAMGNNIVASEELANLPLCGGILRSRRKKRKAKGQDLSWQEKRDKRIEKKFGKNGTSLGEDEDKRISLEINGKVRGSLGSKPRVAQSKRGRELRAAAALARFDTNKKEVTMLQPEPKSADEDAETETESEYEDADADKVEARDFDGQKILDAQGRGMFRVCEGEDKTNVEAQNEMRELVDLVFTEEGIKTSENQLDDNGTEETASIDLDQEDEISRSSTRGQDEKSINLRRDATSPEIDATVRKQLSHTEDTTTNCPVCSMTNDSMRATCIACSHVLDVRKDPRNWKCNSEACKGNEYINSGDCGICGVCGSRQPG